MRKKANKFMVLGLTLAMTVGMMACGTEAKVAKQLTLGGESLIEGDYLAAIDAYEAAIDLDKYEISAYTGLVTALAGDQRDSEEIKAVVEEVSVVLAELNDSKEGITDDKKEAAEGFYNLAANAVSTDLNEQVEVLKMAVDVLGEDSSVATTYEEKAKELVDHYLAGNNLEEAKQFADELAETIPSNTENEELAEEVTQKAEAEQALVDILMIAHGHIEAKDWQALADFSGSEELAIIKEKVGDVGNYTYVFGGGTTGLGIGYYSMEGCDCDEWYVGEYVDGLRSGNGGWYWAKTSDDGLYLDIYEGAWLDDAPNGEGHVYIENSGTVIRDMTTNFKNGLCNGTFTETGIDDEDGYEYTYEYQIADGKYVEIEVKDWLKDKVPEEKYAYYVVYRTMDNGAERAYWGLAYKDAQTEGVAHYRH